MSKTDLDGIIGFNNIYNKYINSSVRNFLKDEGFEYKQDNNGYYMQYAVDEESRRKQPCYSLRYCSTIEIFVEAKGIGIDVEHDYYGGYANSNFFSFEEHGSFAEAYKEMLEFVRRN